MSRPVLERFSASLVDQLVQRELLIVGPAGNAAVAAYVAERLAAVNAGSLLSTVEAALLASDDVEEVFVDLEQLKALVDDMDRHTAGL